MKPYLILLPIFFFALLQGAFLPLNFVLLLVLFWASFRPTKESLLVAFLAGFFLDLAKGTPLGLSSLVLLVTCYVLRIYSRKFDAFHPLFLSIYVFLSVGFWNLVFKNFFNWREAIILAVLTLVVRIFLKFFSFVPEKEGRLKV